ncbi:MAG TPA: F0F1 ATP synthase subunit beta, partial [Bacteroidia bacterium]|nr:F0F1 ATP synthase subunit beta [Bacteroidia bacterium]
MNKGKITQVIGPVVDVSFEGENTKLPNIMEALEIKRPDGTSVILECQQHIGEDTVRAISMDATDGLVRGMEVVATGDAIKMPTGDAIKGRLFNVVGDAVDGMKAVSK